MVDNIKCPLTLIKSIYPLIRSCLLNIKKSHENTNNFFSYEVPIFKVASISGHKWIVQLAMHVSNQVIQRHIWRNTRIDIDVAYEQALGRGGGGAFVYGGATSLT